MYQADIVLTGRNRSRITRKLSGAQTKVTILALVSFISIVGGGDQVWLFLRNERSKGALDDNTRQAAGNEFHYREGTGGEDMRWISLVRAGTSCLSVLPFCFLCSVLFLVPCHSLRAANIMINK